MEKRSLFKQFVRGFLKSFMIMILLLAVGFGSYQLTKFYYKGQPDAMKASSTTLVKDIVSDATVDEISQNLIYSVNEDTGEIEQIVLEIFNTYTGNLDYITIPVNSQVTISNTMHKRLSAINFEVPQILTLSEIGKYFDEKTVYAYGAVILEDILEMHASFYTVIPSTVYDTMFESVAKEVQFQASTSQDTELETLTQAIKVQQFSASFQTETTSLSDEKTLEAYLTSFYEKVESNLSLKKRLGYVPQYIKIKQDQVYYHGIYGQESADKYEINVEAANQQIMDILSNETYVATSNPDVATSNPDVDAENESSSKGLKIEVLNGSNITGLGATYKLKLSDAGYTVVSVGNYTEAILIKTKIMVKEDGMGKDLLEYFNGAELEVNTTLAASDIQIIVGTADKE